MDPVIDQFNEAAREYRDKRLDIDTKLVYLSTASISLLLTFVGILYQGDKSVVALSLNLTIYAAGSWLIAAISLLISNKLVTRIMLNGMADNYVKQHFKYLKFTKSLSAEAKETLKEVVAKLGSKVEWKNAFYTKLSNLLAWVGYTALFLGYAMSLKFFWDLVQAMQQV